MDRLARIDKEGFTSGLFLDQKQQSSPLWVDGANMLFDSGRIQVCPGSVQYFSSTITSTIKGISQLSEIVAGVRGICFGTLANLYTYDVTNGLVTRGTGYTGNANQSEAHDATLWSIQQWNEWIVATNGQNPMQLLKVLGTGFVDMTASTSTQFKYAEIIRKYRQFMIAFNLTKSDGTKQGNAVAWCDVNDVETWVPAVTNSAKKIYIPDMDSDIHCAEKFGEAIFIYTPDQLHVLQYSGYPDVFQPQFALKGVGAYGKNCVDTVQGKHMGIGPRGIWVTDGSSYDYIDTPAVRQHLGRNLNVDQASKIVAYYDRTLRHFMIFYPEVGELENSAGIAFNPRENKFSPLEFARSVATDSGVLDYGITGDRSGVIYRQSLLTPANNPAMAFIPLSGSAQLKLGFGQGGFGQNGFGGIVLG